jgi:hypothetical protein
MNHEALRLVLDSGLRLPGHARCCGAGRSDARISAYLPSGPCLL